MTAGPCSDMPAGLAEPEAAMELTTQSPHQSFAFGVVLGQCLQPPCIIGLSGDLGAGKTVFAQGLARGLGVAQTVAVTSPTYTLINEYLGDVRLFHVDLYRIDDPEQLEDLGFDEIVAGPNVVAVEWAERLAREDFCFDVFIRIQVQSDTVRGFCLNFYGPKAANLVGALQKNIHQHLQG